MGIEMLKKEIEKIEIPNIREFTETALLNADPNFWIVPSSSTKRHHPPEDNEFSGLVNGHIRKGIVVIEEYGRRVGLDQLEKAMAISAFLLHDVNKNGVPWGKHTNYTHGFISINWLKQFVCRNEMAKQIIINAVRYHMAPWCYVVNPFEDRRYSKGEMRKNLDELSRALVSPSRIELAVREADYWSSREGMSFLPGVSALDGLKVHDVPTIK